MNCILETLDSHWDDIGACFKLAGELPCWSEEILLLTRQMPPPTSVFLIQRGKGTIVLGKGNYDTPVIAILLDVVSHLFIFLFCWSHRACRFVSFHVSVFCF